MDIERMADADILRIANPIMDNLMDASTAIDHERHTRDFSDRMKRIVTKITSRRCARPIREKKGYFAAREPVAVFKREVVAIVWKQWFTKVEGEFVAEMLLVEQDGRLLGKLCTGRCGS